MSGEPILGAASYSFSASESDGLGAILGTVSASDPESQPVSFGFGADDSDSPFAIDETTGIITVSAALDFELAASYALTVYAVDTEGNFSSSPVTITLSDSAGDPIMGSSEYCFEADESLSVGTVLGTVSATDSDAPLTYTLDDPLGVMTINSSTGDISLATALNYEEYTSFTATVFVTDSTQVTSSATVTLTINDVDETPDGNVAPYVSSLAFTVTDEDQGFAVGDLVGTIGDDYLTAGEFMLSVDIGGDESVEVVEYTSSSATSAYAEVNLPYGTTTIRVRVDEIEAETGTVLTGNWYTQSITVNPPSNAAPTFGGFIYTADDPGYSGLGYISTTITDLTRHFGSYRIEVDGDDEDTEPDSGADYPLDATKFAYEFSGAPNTSYTLRFRAVEFDNNYDNYDATDPRHRLETAWQTVTFTVPDLINEPPIVDAPASSYQDHGYGSGNGSLSIYFSDAFARETTTYWVEIDFDNDGNFTPGAPNPDGSEDVSMPLNNNPAFIQITNGTGLQGTTPLQQTFISVRLVESNTAGETLASPWVEVGANGAVVAANTAPVFGASSYSKTLTRDTTQPDAVANGVVNGLMVTANDPDAPIRYRLEQVAERKQVGFPGSPWLMEVPKKPLSINETTGQVSIINADVLKSAFDNGHVFRATIRATDGLQLSSTVEVILYDDFQYFITEISTYITKWNGDMTSYINSLATNSQGDADDMYMFLGNRWKLLAGVAAAAELGAIFAHYSTIPGAHAAEVGLAILGFAAGTVAAKNLAGATAVTNSIRSGIIAARLSSHIERAAKWGAEDARLNDLMAELNAASNVDTPDQKASKAADLLAGAHSRLQNVILSVPSRSKIFGHELYKFSISKGWNIQHSQWHQNQFGRYWFTEGCTDWPIIDATDVADKLNSIGWRF